MLLKCIDILTLPRAHSTALSARKVVSQSRHSRGFFSFLWWSDKSTFRPTYNYKPDGSACRVYGSLEVKKVSGELYLALKYEMHIQRLCCRKFAYNYTRPRLCQCLSCRSWSWVAVSIAVMAKLRTFSEMNLSHVINEFSFGPYFPDITQPLDYSFEVAEDRAYITNEDLKAWLWQLQYSLCCIPILSFNCSDDVYSAALRSIKKQISIALHIIHVFLNIMRVLLGFSSNLILNL